MSKAITTNNYRESNLNSINNSNKGDNNTWITVLLWFNAQNLK